MFLKIYIEGEKIELEKEELRRIDEHLEYRVRRRENSYRKSIDSYTSNYSMSTYGNYEIEIKIPDGEIVFGKKKSEIGILYNNVFYGFQIFDTLNVLHDYDFSEGSKGFFKVIRRGEDIYFSLIKNGRPFIATYNNFSLWSGETIKIKDGDWISLRDIYICFEDRKSFLSKILGKLLF